MASWESKAPWCQLSGTLLAWFGCAPKAKEALFYNTVFATKNVLGVIRPQCLPDDLVTAMTI